MERINQDDFYFLVCNGEPIQPANTDMIMDYWTAETVKEFLEAISPEHTYEIIKAVLIDQPQRQERPYLRVMP